MSEVLDYLNTKGIKYKLSGSEAVIICPQCGKPKLSLNVNTSLYQCFVCLAEQPDSLFSKGHLSKLKEYYGDIIPISPIVTAEHKPTANFTLQVNRYHDDILINKKALKYLFSRGINIESIKRFKLGFVRMKEQGWIAIPAFKEDTPVFIKYRKLPPDERPDLEKNEREVGGESILFNHNCIDKYEELMIAEGELDAITLIQQGYENVVGTTVGAGTLKSDWYDQLVMKNKLVICFDADPAGQKAARETWATRLGVSKCWNLEYPTGEDTNSYFQKYNKEDFEELLKSASQFKVKGILSLTETLLEMYRRSKTNYEEVFELPWPSVNRLIGGGFKRTHLIVLGGRPGVGKTSLAIQSAHHFAVRYKMPSLIFCLEMPEVQLATKVIQIHKDLALNEIRYEDALIYLQEMEDIPLYFGYSSKVTPDIFYNTMKEVRDRYGVQFGIFDNLQRMVRDGEESSMSKASGMFKDIAMDLNIPFLLLSQPRKLNTESDPTYDSLKGSAAIPADSDLVILMHRRRIIEAGDIEERYEPITKIIIDKSRFSSGGSTKLEMIGNKSKFVEVKK